MELNEVLTALDLDRTPPLGDLSFSPYVELQYLTYTVDPRSLINDRAPCYQDPVLQLISHWVPALGLWIAKCGKVRGVRKSKSPTDTLWYVYPSGSELLCLLNSEIETQLKVNCFKETFSLTKIWMKLHKIADLKVKLYQSARILTHSFTLSDLLQKCHYL